MRAVRFGPVRVRLLLLRISCECMHQKHLLVLIFAPVIWQGAHEPEFHFHECNCPDAPEQSPPDAQAPIACVCFGELLSTVAREASHSSEVVTLPPLPHMSSPPLLQFPLILLTLVL